MLPDFEIVSLCRTCSPPIDFASSAWEPSVFASILNVHSHLLILVQDGPDHVPAYDFVCFPSVFVVLHNCIVINLRIFFLEIVRN